MHNERSPETSPIAGDTSEVVPMVCDVEVYRAAVAFVRVNQRDPTGEEARAMLIAAGHPRTRASKFAKLSRPKVLSLFHRVCQRVSAFVVETRQLQAMKEEASAEALKTLRECVETNGAFDADPKLLKAKADAAAAVLRICGHSDEQKGRGTAGGTQHHTHVSVDLGGSAPETTDRRAVLRRELYDLESRN